MTILKSKNYRLYSILSKEFEEMYIRTSPQYASVCYYPKEYYQKLTNNIIHFRNVLQQYSLGNGLDKFMSSKNNKSFLYNLEYEYDIPDSLRGLTKAEIMSPLQETYNLLKDYLPSLFLWFEESILSEMFPLA